MSISLVVTDDHPLVLEGIERRLEDESDLKVVARCQDGAQTLRAVRKHRPDILLLDLHLPDMDGFAVLEALSKDKSTSKDKPATRVIILTGHITDEEALQAWRLGVRGVMLKDMPIQMLVRCIRKVHQGGLWIEVHSAASTLEKVARRHESARQQTASGLTVREMEIVHVVASGLRNKEICEELHISEGTVKIHLHNIYKKLHVTGRAELTARARQEGWT